MSNPVIIKNQLERAVFMSPPLNEPVPVYFFEGEVWLNQRDIGTLYKVQRLTVKKHLRNAYKKEKLIETEVTADSKNSKDDEGLSGTKYYNLEAILNVGHRINSAYPLKLEEWVNERKAKNKK